MGLMESTYFFYLIVPLAILVVFLVALVLYYSRKEEDEYEKKAKILRKLLLSGKLDKENFSKMKSRMKNVKNFNTELNKLLFLLSEEKIDADTYARLRQVLEKSFQDKLKNSSFSCRT
jgi:nitrogen fixation-related uncharacterized protein